tara:strand:- start:54 stop:1208 length:1155 start_codon:yes stop_codon:yes gene_type:complete
MPPINFHKKEKPLTSLVSMGGGATGSVLGGIVDKTTDAIWFTNAESNSDLAALSASVLDTLQVRNSSLTETAWKVPSGVTSISIACMGCGGGGMNYPSPASAQGSTSRGGGQLVWRNNITVTPGSTLYVKASAEGVTPRANTTSNYVTDTSRNEAAFPDSAITDYGRSSWVRIWDGGVNKWLCFAGGAQGKFDQTTGGGTGGVGVMVSSLYGTLGTQGTDYNNGNGGSGGGTQSGNYQAYPRGSGGAGGYTGNGGNGSGSQSGDGTAGNGGGAGGAASYHVYNNFTYNGTSPGYAYGGSTYMWGTGDNGAKGNFTFNRPGDGSQTGTAYSGTIPYGLGSGGGGGKDGWINLNAKGPTFHGWVRIVWSKEGVTRTFPSTNIAYPG